MRTGGPLAPGEPTPGASPGLTPSASPGFSRLSLNQITVERASLEQAVEACARHGVPYIAVWRHKLAEAGLERAVRLVRDAGVRVSSVCRGGMFPAATQAEREARCLAERCDPAVVGIVADVYHIWWDPELYDELARAAGRLAGFHVSDWLVPAENVLMNRGIMGDGVIELRSIRAAVERAGYAGPIEVEIFNQKVWSTPLDTLLPLIKERYLACV